MPSIPGLRPARRRREHPAISQRKRDAATPPLSFTDRTCPPEIEKGRDLRSRPSEFLFFSTLKFRISNRRGVYRQLFYIYFRLHLSHLRRNCDSYPLDKFFDLLSPSAISPSNHPRAGSERAGQAHPGGNVRPFFGYNRAAARPRVRCIPPERSWPAAFFRVRSA